MSNSKYKDLLHGEFEPLRHFVDKYNAITNRYERFSILIEQNATLTVLCTFQNEASAISTLTSPPSIPSPLDGEG